MTRTRHLKAKVLKMFCRLSANGDSCNGWTGEPNRATLFGSFEFACSFAELKPQLSSESFVPLFKPCWIGLLKRENETCWALRFHRQLSVVQIPITSIRRFGHSNKAVKPQQPAYIITFGGDKVATCFDGINKRQTSSPNKMARLGSPFSIYNRPHLQTICRTFSKLSLSNVPLLSFLLRHGHQRHSSVSSVSSSSKCVWNPANCTAFNSLSSRCIQELSRTDKSRFSKIFSAFCLVNRGAFS